MRQRTHLSGWAGWTRWHAAGLLALLSLSSLVQAQLPAPAALAPGQTTTKSVAPASIPPATPAQPPAESAQPVSTSGQVKGQAHSLATVEPAHPVDPTAEVRPAPGTLVDQVVGIVNGDLVLESDVNEERRFEAFQPYRNSADFSRVEAIRRLVDRQLILQQAKLNPDNAVTDQEAEAQLKALRKDIPACKQYHCETDAGWAKFVRAQGFTLPELLVRWKQRMEILKFIETRFRMGVQITPAQIKTYYDETLLPQFASKGVKAPPLASISDRIQEVLLQQQVSSLLGDWLKQLKAEGTVRMMRPDGVQP